MNKKLLAVLVLAALLLAGVGVATLQNKPKNTTSDKTPNNSSSNAAEPAQTGADAQKANQITYKNFEVMPPSLTVKKGTTVTWNNQDSANHSVTPDSETDGFKASELFNKDGSYSLTFNTPGTYKFHCTPHPYMKTAITVAE